MFILVDRNKKYYVLHNNNNTTIYNAKINAGKEREKTNIS